MSTKLFFWWTFSSSDISHPPNHHFRGQTRSKPMPIHRKRLLVDGLQSYGTKKAREPLGRARAADFERLAGVFASRVATAAPPPLTPVPDQTGKNQIATSQAETSHQALPVPGPIYVAAVHLLRYNHNEAYEPAESSALDSGSGPSLKSFPLPIVLPPQTSHHQSRPHEPSDGKLYD